MATLILSAAGAALGGSFGGSILGVSAALLGRAAGATIGNFIDQRLLGAGSAAVPTGRANSLRLMGAKIGTPIARVFGRSRVGGNVIWATRFKEFSHSTGTGKALAAAGPSVRQFGYSISFAVGLCEGEISRVGKIWADGKLLKQKYLNFRVHNGSETQLPDPLIEAVEGVGNAPACRGLAYIVFESLALEEFGNRIPQISAEVFRRVGKPHIAELIQSVALVPGTGEYALATEHVRFSEGKGKSSSPNVNNGNGRPDFVESMMQLEEELPNCSSVSLVVSWFGSNLSCGNCLVLPKVEQNARDANVSWRVSGIGRMQAEVVSLVDERPAFGGTPSDESVVQAIKYLNDHNKRVTFYPFLLMDIQAGNGLVDPWSGVTPQPNVPWRGRITLARAPGQPGSSDNTNAAASEVAQFFGTANASDFVVADEEIAFSAAPQWSYRRFILHYAHLCALAGGVDTFCIGSELRGLTQIRDGSDGFPAVEHLRALAADVRAILGATCKITYAADWSEYFGYHPQEGSGDVFFNLDPLWADANINFIGIDNYMPLSDWRNSGKNLDDDWKSPYNLDYLKSNIEGGEGYDWYYESLAKRDLQLRSGISDGGYDEPWVFRYKDIRNWWSNSHHNRQNSVRSVIATDWVAKSKPIVFMEVGCPAIHNGANQPNCFLDLKSSESAVPYYSNGGKDQLAQASFLTAVLEYWSEGENNPLATDYVGRMVDVSRTNVWAWDTRPWPNFPERTSVWSDAANFDRGHWINGRIGDAKLADVVAEICAASGLVGTDVTQLYGSVTGMDVTSVESGRQTLQSLMLCYGFDCFETDGRLVFRSREIGTPINLDSARFAHDAESGDQYTVTRNDASEMPGRLRLEFILTNGEYQTGAVEVVDCSVGDRTVSTSTLPMLLDDSEAKLILERWINESGAARETISFNLPISFTGLSGGDLIEVAFPLLTTCYRVDRIEEGAYRKIEAVKVEREIYARSALVAGKSTGSAGVAASPMMFSEFLDLPVLGNLAGPFIAACCDPWQGPAAVYSSASNNGYILKATVESCAIVGQVLEDLPPADSGRWMRHSVRIKVSSGALATYSEEDVYNGENLIAVRKPGLHDWELLQFRSAVLSGPNEYILTDLLRGQFGTEFLASETVPSGSDIVVVNSAIGRIDIPDSICGLPRHYRVGPAIEPWSDESYQHSNWTCGCVGLRPYAPVHLHAQRQADGAIQFTWIRRTRLDGDSWEGPDVPLAETRETYQVRLAGGVRLVETTAPIFSYSLAEQVSDGLTAPFDMEVAQISDRFGTGPFARITFDE